MSNKVLKRLKKFFDKENLNVLLELTRANIKVTDHQSIFGVLWSLLGPLALLFVMFLIFRDRFGHDQPAYLLYLLIGIVCVNFFVTTTMYLVRILAVNREFLLNAMVMRESFVLSHLFVFSYNRVVTKILTKRL